VHKDSAESGVTVEDNTATFAAESAGKMATCTVTNTFPEPTTTPTTTNRNRASPMKLERGR
jgi:hypothetical protein